MRTTHLLTFLLCVSLSPLWAVEPLRLSGTLEWFSVPQRIRSENGVQSWWSFKGALHDDAMPLTPLVVRDFPVQGGGTLQVRVLDLRTEALPGTWPASVPLPPDRLSYNALVEKDRQSYFGKISFAPFLLVQGNVHRVLEYSLEATWIPQPEAQARSGEFAGESALRNGTIYKISVAQEGMHKISYDFLKNELKIDIDRIDPRQIALWGNSGGMLPEPVGAPKPDDLVEIPVFIAGESDGRFDSGDYLLFYAEGPDKWTYQAGTGRFSMEKNIYSQQQFYFLKIGSGTGQRVAEQANLATATYASKGFDDFARLETDKINLLHQWVTSKGSGKRWYGDQIRNVREYKYDKFFNFPNLIAESPVLVRAEMALRALQTSRFTLSLNGTTLTSGLAERVVELEGELDNIRDYAKNALLEGSLNLNSDAVEAIIRYAPPGGPNDGSEGWVDYIELQARRRLVFTGDQMAFRDIETLGQPSSAFELNSTTADIAVWDISNPLRPMAQATERSPQQIRFRTASETLRQFVAFNPAKALYAPKAVGKVENQNLHGISRADLLLIYPASMAAQAAQLAAHRRKHSGLVVEAVEVQQISNEFSSG
ncbi:MAG: C25 family cysteine peptidase, partial [Haliscomenobacter sp.]